METTMKDYITEQYEQYKKRVLQFDEDKFTNDVLKSFIDAKTLRHYVLLITCDLNEYYSSDEHNIFEKDGYYQQPLPDRYNNRFFIPQENIDNAADILSFEKMRVEETRVNNVKTYVISLDGMYNTFFQTDYTNPDTK